jgi:hypothetical protein
MSRNHAQAFLSQHLATSTTSRRRSVPPSPPESLSQLQNQRWRERPRCPASPVTPGRRDGVVHATTWLSVSDEVGVAVCGQYAPLAAHNLRPDQEGILYANQGRAYEKSCAVSPARSARPSDRMRAGPAVTYVSVELCSTPYKVLRVAPTPLARGLRTLTASARSSRTWLLRAGRGLRAGLLRTSARTDESD